jgi:hypothetical protein
MLILLRVPLVVVMVLTALVTPSAPGIPGSSASAAVVYEDSSSVVDCGGLSCSLYISRSRTKAFAYSYENEWDLAQAIASIACTLATKRAIAAVCGPLLDYAVKEFVRDGLKRTADEEGCLRITTAPFFDLFNRGPSVRQDDSELCRA